MRMSRSFVAALSAAVALAITPVQPGHAQGVLGESGLVGELEGATLQPDAARPAKLSEAPMLAERVKAGTLPPVEQRVPDEPLVIKPVHEIGRYGGIWRRGFTGPGDVENGNRINASDKPLFWDPTGTEDRPVGRPRLGAERGRQDVHAVPAQGHEVVGRRALHRRRLRVLVRGPLLEQGDRADADRRHAAAGQARPRGQDRRHHGPVPVRRAVLSVRGHDGRRHADRRRPVGAAVAEVHLRRLFAEALSVAVPAEDTAPRDEVNAKAKEAGYENWVQFLHFKKDWALNPELPTLGPWKTIQPINTPNWVLERNPFYWAVDTEGNQLPYIDRVQLTLAENLEVLNLRAVAGEYDLQERHIDLAKLPVILENQKNGGYTVHLDLAYNGSDSVLQINQSYDADPEIAKWLTNADFRRALSMGLDRDQLNETFWLGVGEPGSVVPAESSPYNPGPGVSHDLVDPRRRQGQRAARFDRPDARRTARASACAPTMASGCGSRSRPPRPSCPIPSRRR